MSEAIERLAAELGRVIAAATGRLSDEHRDDLPAVAAALMRDCGLVAVPDLAAAVQKARADLEGATADYFEIRERGEDCEPFRRLSAAADRVGNVDPWRAWKWLIPGAQGRLADAYRALADAVLAQLGGGR